MSRYTGTGAPWRARPDDADERSIREMALDIDLLRKRLEQMKLELERDQAISESARAPVELDQTSVGRLSRIDAMQVQAMALANQQRRKIELDRVVAALRRIDADDFGYCSVCGEAIAQPRLEHNPAVTSCINCAV
jgi:DnaK suppressor protein